MTGMVSGRDAIFETPRQGFDVRILLEAVLNLWPDAQFQEADDEQAKPLAEAAIGNSREFFVYKNEAAATSWNDEGWTEQHENDLAHFIVQDDPTDRDRLHVTVVIGSVTEDTQRLLDDVLAAFRRMTGAAGTNGAAAVMPRVLRIV